MPDRELPEEVPEGDVAEVTPLLHGAACSSLQAEGAASAADWGGWERAGWVPRSVDGNGFAAQHAEDAVLLAQHGLGSLRITLEWARLEPKETGRLEVEEVERYRRILRAIRAAGIEAWACLAHTSLPGWFSEDERGFLDEGMARRVWPAHVDRVAEAFGDLVDGWITFHEPVRYAIDGFLLGRQPPGRMDGDDALLTLRNLQRADAEAARLLRSPGRAPVASCQWLPPIFPIDGSPAARIAAARAEDLIWGSWRDLDDHDWIGVSCAYAVAVDGGGGFHPWPASIEPGPMGWAPWHQAVAHTLHRVAEERSGRPIVLLTGAADTDDERRDSALRDLASAVAEAVDDRIPLQRVHWWSAVDGYEGHHGFGVRTGLFDRDRNPTGINALGLPKPGAAA